MNHLLILPVILPGLVAGLIVAFARNHLHLQRVAAALVVLALLLVWRLHWLDSMLSANWHYGAASAPVAAAPATADTAVPTSAAPASGAAADK